MRTKTLIVTAVTAMLALGLTTALNAADWVRDANGHVLIQSKADLETLRDWVAAGENTVGMTFLQTADIDLCDVVWAGIGARDQKDNLNEQGFLANPFRGVYDGHGHTILNVKLKAGDYDGFFNSVDRATIRNLKMSIRENGIDTTTSGSAFVTNHTMAVFVGVAKESTLANLETIRGETVATREFRSRKDASGIVGLMVDGVVEGCTNNLDVTFGTVDNRKGAGIVLLTQSGSDAVKIKSCLNAGRVRCNTCAQAGAGGILGFVGQETLIECCENRGSVETVVEQGAHVGTIVGFCDKAFIERITSKANKAQDSILSAGLPLVGLNFATVENSVASFVADDALTIGSVYRVMTSVLTNAFHFSSSGSIAFDCELNRNFRLDVTAESGLVLSSSEVNGVRTYRAEPTITVGVSNVVTRQRYPWNGLVDIDCEIACSSAQGNVNLWIEAKNKATGQTLPVRHIWLENDVTCTNALAVKAGRHRLVWDAGADAPNVVSSDVTITVRVQVPAGQAGSGSVRGDQATGTPMRLDTRTGVRIVSEDAKETLVYSPRWGGAANCAVTADGVVIKTASSEGEVTWSPTSVGMHTLTFAAGNVAYTAQFRVKGALFPMADGGTGTQESPYLISSVDGLENLRLAVEDGMAGTAHFKLINDLDMSAYGPWPGIGQYDPNDTTGENAFRGVFDGGGHTIRGLYFTRRTYGGLFNQVWGGTVRNLSIEFGGQSGFAFAANDTNVSTNEACGAAAFVGHAAGNACLEGLTSLGRIEGTHNVAGIVIRLGGAEGCTVVRGCTNRAEIVGHYTKASGISVLTIDDGSTVLERCCNEGIVHATAGTTVTGSLIGCDGVSAMLAYCSQPTTIRDCENRGNVFADEPTALVGELVGLSRLEIAGSGNIIVKGKRSLGSSGGFSDLYVGRVVNGNVVCGVPLSSNQSYEVLASFPSNFVYRLENDGDWISFDTTVADFNGQIAKSSPQQIILERRDGSVRLFTVQTLESGDGNVVHAGQLTTNETWTSESVHLVTDEIKVPSGRTLTIEPGAVVKFATGTSLIVNGSCLAHGVVFTHLFDDTVGGDTLKDGDATTPVMGAYTLSGNINEDDATEERYSAPQTLTSSISGTVRLKGHKVYLAKSSVTVNSGATLTLMPGAVIKFASGCSMTVRGTLNARGTRAAPIVFTSQKDDEWGGDTNGDGDRTYPYAGDWSRIVCSGTVTMDHCRIWYASDTSDQGAIQGSGGTVRFDNGEIAHMVYECVRMNSGSFVSYNSVFRDSSMGFGYYGGSGTYVYNGVVEGCSSACRASNKHFYNTIFYRCPTFLESTSSSCSNCLFFNPPGYGAQSAAQIGQNGNIWGDPLFLDPDNGDFRITKQSPAIDAGDAGVAPELDYWGQPRNGAPDIGIFEYQGNALSPNDLVAVEVSASETVTAGETLNVRWRVANGGTKAISGSWRDRVSLTDGAGEYALGTVISSGNLPVGVTNEFGGTFAVPAELEGTWRVRVHVNAERDIYEGTVNVTNNTATSARTTTVTVRAESIEDGFTGAVPAGGSASAKFAVLGGEPLIGRIVAPIGTIVYFGDGFAPTTVSYSAKARVDANGGVIGIPSGVGTAYFTVTTESGAAAQFSIAFESGALAVRAANPGSVPSSGRTGVKVSGANFAEGCEAELLAGGVVIADAVEKTAFVSATELVLTLDCDKLQAGKGYAVRVRTAAGETAVLDNAVTVASAPPKAVLTAKLDVPSTVRQGRTITAYVEYENTGNIDMPAPIFEIVSKGQVFKVDGHLYTNGVKVVGLSTEAPRGTLRPGEPQRLAVQVTCMAANVKWQLKSYHAAQEGAKTAKFSLRELYDDDWVLYHDKSEDGVVSAIRAANGSTWSDYYADFGRWLDECDEMVVDYGVMKRAYAQHLYRHAEKTLQSASVSSAVRESSNILSAPQCGKHPGAKTAADWKEVGNGAVYMLCPTCRQWFLLDKTTKGNFDASKQTYLICHGMRNSIETDWILKMGQALIARTDGKAMVLAVNWGEGAFGFLDLLPHESASYVPEVAKVVFDQLTSLEIVPGNTTLIGHSHGGHIAGQIVYHYANENGGDFKRMVGLDVSTTDWSVHGWVPKLFADAREFSFDAFKGLSPTKWFSAVEKHCKQSEFYKTSWDMSLEEPSELFAQWNFSVVSGEGEFYETTAGFVAHDELERHSYACEWFVNTIKNANGKYDNKGFNFVGDSSWKAICGNSNKEATGASDIRKPKKGEMAGVIRDDVYELLEIRNARSLWRYADLVLSGQARADSSIANGRLFHCHSLSYDDNLSVEMPVSGAIASGQSLSVTIKNDADNRSVPFDMLYKSDSARFEDAGKSLDYATFTSAWLVDVEGLGVDDWDWSSRKMSHLVNLLKDYSHEEYVRKISVDNGQHLYVAPGKADKVSLQLSFNNAAFDELRPLLYVDDGGDLQHRHVLLVIGNSRSPFPMKWPDDRDGDIYPDDNFVIQEVVAVPQNTWAVISRRSAQKNALKSLSYSASYSSASAFAPQLSANALKPGEVVQVTAAKDGTWSIELDGSESFSLAEDALDILSFTLPDYGSTKGVVTLNGKGARCDLPWTTVSGRLPSGVDADGNPVCEGERYTVKLTVYTQEGDEASVSCVLDVRYAMDEDEGEGEDEVGSSSPKSCDPNEMSGPEGEGEERLVKPGDWMTYTIYFENKSDAEAAAAMVTVTNPLNEWLDWESFEMLDVAFGSQTDTGLLGKSSGVSSVTVDGTNTSVRAEVDVDLSTGVATWFLRIVDPDGDADGWPLDPYAGFLPPNDETHCGEGRISYRVRVREDAPANARIDNSATIVFDYNEPIETDPAWWNTVSSTAVETSGQYVTLDLADELGLEIPDDVDYAAGDKVAIKVEGLAKGLKVVATPVYEDPNAKKKVIVDYVYTIEGVPTEPVDFEKQPMYARVTVTYKDKTKTADKTGKAESLQPVPLSIEPAEVRTLEAGVLNEVYEPVDIASLWPEVADAKTNPKEWSFKGWPAGLKYNATAKDASWSYKDDKATVKATAEPYTVYGQPTKAGEYPITATWKHKLADGKTTVSETFSAVLTVWGDDGASDFRAVSQAYVALTKNFGTGVTAMSGLPTGLKFTAKAVAATAKAPAQEAGDVYGTPTKPGVFAVTATLADKTKETFLWKVTEGENPGLDAAAIGWADAKVKFDGETKKATILQGLEADFAVEASALAAGAKVTVSGLPSGLKYDAKTGRITGVATKQESKVVTVKVVQNGVTEVRTFAIVVDANPFAGTYYTYLIKPKSGVESYAATAVVTPAVGGSAKVVLDEYVPSLGKTVKTTVTVKGFTMLSEYDPAESDEIEIMYAFKLAANAKGNPDYATEEREFLVALWRWTDEGVGFSEGECALRSSGFGVNGGVIKALTAAEYVTYAEKFAKAAPEVVTAVVQDDAGHFLYGSAVFDEKKVQYQLTGKLRDGTAVKALLPLGTLDGGFVSAPCLLVEKGGTKRAAVGALLETEDSGEGTAMKMWLWGTAAGQMKEPCSRFDKSGIPATAAAALGGDSELVLDAAELAASGFEGEAPAFRFVVNGTSWAKAKLDIYAPGVEEGAKPLASLASAKLQASAGYVFKGSFKWEAKVGGDGNTYSFELVPSTTDGKTFVGRCEVKPAKGAAIVVTARLKPEIE